MSPTVSVMVLAIQITLPSQRIEIGSAVSDIEGVSVGRVVLPTDSLLFRPTVKDAAVLSDGTIVVIPTGKVIFIYDSTLTLQRTIPLDIQGHPPYRIARGVTNVAAITNIVGDETHVFDSKFESQIVLQHPAHRVFETAALPGGQLIVNATSPSREFFGYPLLRVSPRRGIVGVVGNDLGAFRLSDPVWHRRLYTTLDSQLWVAETDTYRIERWLVGGDGAKMVARYQREVPWGPQKYFEHTMSPNNPPPAEVRGISVDSEGLLWVVVAVLDSAYWHEGIESFRRVSDGSVQYAVRNPHQVFDTVIEAIDLGRQEVIATRRLPEFVNVWAHGEVAVMDYGGVFEVRRFRVKSHQP